MAVRIILFEDNVQLRESLVLLLNNSSQYKVSGHYADCTNAATAIANDEPDVVIMDIDMPGKSGIDGVRTIKELRPDVPVIMYTMFEDDKKIFDSLCAGANGYILKKTAPGKLFDAIQEVVDGGSPMSPSIARKVLQSFQHTVKKNDYHLSQREIQILELLIKGYVVKQIASNLNIAYDTARTHLRNIYTKLHVNCGKEAIAKALIEKII